LKKLDAVELDVENFKKKIEVLSSLCHGLVSRGHFDSDNIRETQAGLESKYRDLLELAAARRRKLVETKKLFEFHREVEDIEAWIIDKNAVAGSEDYGTDIEHVQVEFEFYTLIRFSALCQVYVMFFCQLLITWQSRNLYL